MATILVLLSYLLWIYQLTHYCRVGFVVFFSLNPSADLWPPYWFCCRFCFESMSWLITTALALLLSFFESNSWRVATIFVLLSSLNLSADLWRPLYWFCSCLCFQSISWFVATVLVLGLSSSLLLIHQLTRDHRFTFVLVFAFNPSADSWPPYWFCRRLCFDMSWLVARMTVFPGGWNTRARQLASSEDWVGYPNLQ